MRLNMPTHPSTQHRQRSLRKVFNYTEIKAGKLMGHQAANQQENKPINYTFASTHAVFRNSLLCYLHEGEKWRKRFISFVCVYLSWNGWCGGVGKREKGHLKDCFRWNPFPSSFAALCRKTYERKNCFMAFLSSYFFCFQFYFFLPFVYFKLQHHLGCLWFLQILVACNIFKCQLCAFSAGAITEKKNRFFLDNWTAPSVSRRDRRTFHFFLSRFFRVRESLVSRLVINRKTF